MNPLMVPRYNIRQTYPLCGLTLLCVAGGLAWHFLEPISRHMLTHIALMAVAAPMCVWLLWGGGSRLSATLSSPGVLWLLCLLQMAAFLFWHTPRGMTWAMSGWLQSGLLQGSLFVCACAFWAAIRLQAIRYSWHAVLALLLTGKVFCLVALLLLFAPRFLYAMPHHAVALHDQQLAGALMVVLCPLVYVLSAVVILNRWLSGLSGQRPSADS